MSLFIGLSPAIAQNTDLIGGQLAKTGVDSSKTDTTQVTQPGTYSVSKDGLDAKVFYKATDSIIYDVANEKVHLYGAAEVKFEEMTLQAEYIVFDWIKKTVTAEGVLDSLGNKKGIPYFSEEEDGFTANKIIYDFEKKVGKIYDVRTQEGEGYIGGREVRKNEKNELFIRDAFYTTCNLDHPHFKIESSKIKAVPNNYIVTGPANLVIEDVPTPLYLPFGIFPIAKGQRSGLILPTYGESQTLGFFFKRGGYYFAINDYMDLTLTGDVYTRGSFGLNVGSNFRKRYKYNGSVRLSYANNKFGNVEDDNFTRSRNFFTEISYNQDAKARPNSRLSASINAGTNDYHSNNTLITDDYLSNTFESSISYSKTFQGSPFSLSANLRHNQNTNSKIINLTLPDVTFSMRRIYPLRKQVRTGKRKWFEDVGVSYTTNFRNLLSAPDSTLFTSTTLKNARYGMQHNIPISTSFKVAKHITLTPSANYRQVWYYKTREYNYQAALDSVFIQDNTGFNVGQSFNTGVRATTRIYGVANFKGNRVKALRHVVTPTVGYEFQPDFGNPKFGYWKQYATGDSNAIGVPIIRDYSIFERGVFGGPGRGKRSGLRFSLDNNIEMKVGSKKDTIRGEKKVKIFESLNASTFYNFAADSVKLDRIRVGARTNLLNKLNIVMNATYDPYIRNSDGQRLNTFEWERNKRLARFVNGSIRVNTSFSGGKGVSRDQTNQTGEEVNNVFNNLDDYVDFNIPWSIRAGYVLNFNNRGTINELGVLVDSVAITQTLTASGELNLTPKWKLAASTSYDWQRKQFSATSIEIIRDLHCWEMRFYWIPFGPRQSYNFTLNVKSSVLQDLKINRRRDWFDY